MKAENIIKLDTLNEMSGGDKSFISEIFTLFLSHIEEYLKDSESAFAANDYPLLKKTAHKFKSSVQLFEITEIVSLILKVEDSTFPNLQESEKQDILKRIKELSLLAASQVKELSRNYK
jgi:HPt (histidine-containing phosphotransfer) domain-containing protein